MIGVMHELPTVIARRLALVRAGLLKPGWTGLPKRAAGRGKRARDGARAVIERFGYLQLDTVSVAGARSHALVLLSRLEGLDPELGEELLRPGAPLFEYWGHEASWIPIELYPAFEFRRQAYAHHPWWGDVAGEHPRVADRLRERLRSEGPLRSADLEGEGGRGWWDLKVAKRVALHLWSSGEIAIRERRAFQRTYDLAERVIPAAAREAPLPEDEGIATLLLRALGGHGWATTGTLASTWRLRNRGAQLARILGELAEERAILPCALVTEEGRRIRGWIRPEHLELAGRLDRVRPRRDRGVLLSPFDPILWDRGRVETLFGFHQTLEIFKPAAKRIYGYYCLPVLAGEELVARLDLKAERHAGRLRVLSCRYEATQSDVPPSPDTRESVRTALERHAEKSLALRIEGAP